MFALVSDDDPTQKVTFVSVTRCFDAQGGILSRSAYCEIVVRLPDGGRLAVETTTWSTFVNAVKSDDLPA